MEITLASSSINSSLINAKFQHLRSISIREATFKESNPSLTGDCTLNVVGLGIHLSPQMLMLHPSPTRHIRPCCSRSRAEKMLLHAKEGLFPREAPKKDEWGKYLALKICPTKESGCWTNREHYLARRAILKRVRTQKPNPPTALDFPIFP